MKQVPENASCPEHAGTTMPSILATTSTIQHLPLAQIRLDHTTQARVAISTLVVDEYAAHMKAGAIFPPIVVIWDGDQYWVGDGHHRCHAAKQAGCTTIAAEVRHGSQRDAILYAVAANALHGLRRTNADKRRAVEMLLMDEEWSRWSDRQIAKQCGVGNEMVSRLRRLICANRTDGERYAVRHGKTYAMRVARIHQSTEPIFDALARLPEALRAQIRESPLADQPKELHALARLSTPEQQSAVAVKLLAGEARTVQEAIRQLAYAKQQTVNLREAVRGKYEVILADPAWQYRNARLQGAAEDHYPTLSTDELCAMPVIEFAATNAVLFLWATNALLVDALTVMKAWGFVYRTNLCWVKDKATFGKLGFYLRGRHELLLIGTRGSCLPKPGCLPESILVAAKGAHSEKPEQIYEIIEMMYGGGKLELFARRTRPGWTAFGNEVREPSVPYTTGETGMPDASHIHTVLLVEDEADLRSLFTLVLEIAGFRVTSVARAEEALEALAQERFAVVLTDYQLEGGMSGDALIREIHTKDSGVVTMLMSAHPNLSSIGDACQANAVFWKGTELAQLPVLIRLLLSRSL